MSLPSTEILTALCSLCPPPQPQTPHLEEDLKEVLRSEAGIELIIEDDVKPEKQKRKQGVSRLRIQCQLLSAVCTYGVFWVVLFILLLVPKCF